MTKRPTKPAKGVPMPNVANVFAAATDAASKYTAELLWPPEVNSKTRFNAKEVECMARLGFMDGYLAGYEVANPATPKGVRR